MVLSANTFGYWNSPISAEMVANSAKRFSQVQCDRGYVYWLEQRPAEAGRQVVVRASQEGVCETITPKGYNVRTRVHEYGGGDYLVQDGVIYFSNASDQRIYRQNLSGLVEPVTPVANGVSYADFEISKQGRYLFAVRESVVSSEHECVNELICIDLAESNRIHVIATGQDFYASPKLAPNEKQLAWLAWSHPNMPWDETALWCTDLDGVLPQNSRPLIHNAGESLYQPAWSPKGDLYVVSDRTGWWNIYRVVQDDLIAVAPIEAECGTTQWVFGTRMYGFTGDGALIAIVTNNAQQKIGVFRSGEFVPFQLSQTTIEPYIALDRDHVFFIGSSETSVAALWRWDISKETLCCVSKSGDDFFQLDYLSSPESIAFKGKDDEWVHAFYYPPKNPDVKNTSELPPLIVCCHGGPIAFTTTALNLKIQYWTSRGFAVVDVNYSGSAGYGRAYRDRLKGRWGEVDVSDCVYAARFLVKHQKVDPARLCIRGSSAGGYTALCALTFYDDFAAGASYYGISDLSGLLTGMPKFESRNLDTLVGEYDKHPERYFNRSPVHFADKINAGVIIFQGLKDVVVPFTQAELILSAMKKGGLSPRYVAFEQEGHGFRNPDNVATALTEELAFYQAALYTQHHLRKTVGNKNGA